MGKRGRLASQTTVLLGLILEETACVRDGPPRPVSGEVAVEPNGDAVVRERLAPYAVDDDHFGRRTLFSWTTAAQIAELRACPILLTRTQSDERGISFYQQFLSLHAAQKSDKTSKLLVSASYAQLRFAWPSPWPTMLGVKGEMYGDALLRIVLRPEAIVARIDTTAQTWSFQGADGRPVPASEAAEHPDRIAAVYFVNRGDAPGSDGLPRPAYREYVLCNERMIEEFSFGTKEIESEMASGAEVLEVLREYLDRAHPPSRAVVGVYEAALAFPNDRYTLDPSTLAGLADALAQFKVGHGPIRQKPTIRETFPRPRAVGVSPCFRGGGTY